MVWIYSWQRIYYNINLMHAGIKTRPHILTVYKTLYYIDIYVTIHNTYVQSGPLSKTTQPLTQYTYAGIINNLTQWYMVLRQNVRLLWLISNVVFYNLPHSCVTTGSEWGCWRLATRVNSNQCRLSEFTSLVKPTSRAWCYQTKKENQG